MAKWSVWKHGGLTTSKWTEKLNTDDETYARYVYRYVCDETKEGRVELRQDNEVVEDTRKDKSSRIKRAAIDNTTEPDYAPHNTYDIFTYIATINSIFNQFYSRYKNGEITYTTMLVESIINLSDWDKVGAALESHLWETGSEHYPAEKITSKSMAAKYLDRVIQETTNNVNKINILLKIIEEKKEQ